MEGAVELGRLRLRPFDLGGELVLGEPVRVAQVDAAAGRDRAERVLGLEGMADLAHRDDVERELERACDLGSDDDAAAGEPDHDGVGERLAGERACEHAAGVAAVGKERLALHAAMVTEPRPGRGKLDRRADVAQLVEHITRNDGVRGSSPRVGSPESPAQAGFSFVREPTLRC